MLQYNIKKSVIINCGKNIYKDEDIDIKMNGIRLPVVEMSKYRGLDESDIESENDLAEEILNDAVVLDIGSYSSRIGYAGEDMPKVK